MPVRWTSSKPIHDAVARCITSAFREMCTENHDVHHMDDTNRQSVADMMAKQKILLLDGVAATKKQILEILPEVFDCSWG